MINYYTSKNNNFYNDLYKSHYFIITCRELVHNLATYVVYLLCYTIIIYYIYCIYLFTFSNNLKESIYVLFLKKFLNNFWLLSIPIFLVDIIYVMYMICMHTFNDIGWLVCIYIYIHLKRRKTRVEAEEKSVVHAYFIRVNVGRKREFFVFYFMYAYLDIQVIAAAWLSLNFFYWSAVVATLVQHNYKIYNT